MRLRASLKKTALHKIKGDYLAKGMRFGIVVSQFNEFLTNRLLDGCVDTLRRHGAIEKDIKVIYVPGAFEIPLALKKLLKETRLDAVVTLSVVIRGETKHFDQVTLEAARGAQEAALGSGVPVILGMIPAENEAQAIRRVGLKQMSKGREWALAAIEMASLMKKSFAANGREK